MVAVVSWESWPAKHPEKRAVHVTPERRAQLRAGSKRWRLNNPEFHRAYNREWMRYSRLLKYFARNCHLWADTRELIFYWSPEL